VQIIFNNFLIISFTDGKGEVTALAAACLWAVASVVYGLLGQRIPPMQLSLMKGIIAIALLLLTILMSGELLPQLSPLPVCFLGALLWVLAGVIQPSWLRSIT